MLDPPPLRRFCGEGPRLVRAAVAPYYGQREDFNGVAIFLTALRVGKIRKRHPTLLMAQHYVNSVEECRAVGKLELGHPYTTIMLTRQDIQTLMHRYKLLNIEVDERHMKLINEVFQLGVNVGINKAKESVVWRINGPLWASFIDKGMTDASLGP